MSIVALVVLSQDTDWKEVQMVWCDDTVLEVHDDIVQDLTNLPEMSKVEEINNNQLHEMETMLADLVVEDDPETASLQHLPCRQRRQSPQKNLLPNVSDVEREQDNLPEQCIIGRRGKTGNVSQVIKLQVIRLQVTSRPHRDRSRTIDS